MRTPYITARRSTRAFGIHHQDDLYMPSKRTSEKEHVEYHKDGSVWAKGKIAKGVPTGYWEWFRRDRTKMRSGYFENGRQVGEWITYDKKGQKYKVTHIKLKKK